MSVEDPSQSTREIDCTRTTCRGKGPIPSAAMASAPKQLSPTSEKHWRSNDHEDIGIQRGCHILWGNVETCGDETSESDASSVSETGSLSESHAAATVASQPQSQRQISSSSGYCAGTDQEPVYSMPADISAADLFSEGAELHNDSHQNVTDIPLDVLLTDEELQELLAVVPLDHTGSLTSLGSLEHHPRACKRACLFLRSPSGCSQGILCDFCHFPHKRKDKVRPCKGKRDRYRRLLDRKRAECENDVESSQASPGQFPRVPLEHGISVEEARASVLAKIRLTEALDVQSSSLVAVAASGAAASSSSSQGACSQPTPQQHQPQRSPDATRRLHLLPPPAPSALQEDQDPNWHILRL